jgi:integrase
MEGQSGQRSTVVRAIHRGHGGRGGRGEAATELERFIREIGSEKTEPETRIRTFDDVFSAYIEHCRRIGRCPGTVESYEMVGKRITPEMKAKGIDILAGHDFDEYYGDLDKTLGANTIRQTHAVLHAAYDQEVKWGWITANPMAVILATITGARRGELAGLRWDDIGEETCSVRIERQWVPGNGGQHLGPSKSSDGPRTVVLGEMGMALLTRYRHLMGELLNRELVGWVLSHDAGTTPLRARALGTAISRLGMSFGIEVSTRSFRRASVTELMASGVDADTSARRLGHTTEVMLQSYVLGSDDRAIAAAGTLESRLAERGLPLGELLPVPG